MRESFTVSSEHRLEYLPSIEGKHFVNDSKATNVNSTWYALEEMPGKVILLMGGVDKGNDYSILLDVVKKKVRYIIFIGNDNKPLIKAFKNIVPFTEADTMRVAVLTAFKIAERGQTILLSPACASFDRYENYEERGREFKKIVKSL